MYKRQVSTSFGVQITRFSPFFVSRKIPKIICRASFQQIFFLSCCVFCFYIIQENWQIRNANNMKSQFNLVLLRIPQQKRAGFERIPLKSCTFQVSVQRLFFTLSLLTRRADAFKDQPVPRDPIPGFRCDRFVRRWVV